MFKMWKLIVIFAVIIGPIAARLQAKTGANHELDSKPNNAEPKEPKIFTGVRLSAWGVLYIILGFILVSGALYYLVVCYPILCERRRRRYDSMELNEIPY